MSFLPTDHFYIVGDQLLVGQTSLDFEFSSVYRISITSTDSGSPAQSLTVRVPTKLLSCKVLNNFYYVHLSMLLMSLD